MFLILSYAPAILLPRFLNSSHSGRVQKIVPTDKFGIVCFFECALCSGALSLYFDIRFVVPGFLFIRPSQLSSLSLAGSVSVKLVKRYCWHVEKFSMFVSLWRQYTDGKRVANFIFYHYSSIGAGFFSLACLNYASLFDWRVLCIRVVASKTSFSIE